jgi:hypothetical protein
MQTSMVRMDNSVLQAYIEQNNSNKSSVANSLDMKPNSLFAYVCKGEDAAQSCIETLAPLHGSTGRSIHEVEPSKSDSRNTIGAKAILHGEYGLKNRNVMVVAWEHGHMHGTVVSNYVANNESTPYTFMYSNDEKKKKN